MPEQEPVSPSPNRLETFLKNVDARLALAGVSLVFSIGSVFLDARKDETLAGYGPPAKDSVEYAGSGRLPAALPPAVRQQVGSAVKVYGDDREGGFEASGVKVGFDRILTAGHVVAPDATSELMPGCENIWSANRYSVPDEEDHITGMSYTYNHDDLQSYGPDIAELRITPSPRFAFARTPSVSAEDMQRGDTVYFINYELGPEGTPNRYPNTTELKGHGHRADWDGPAEYAGVVLLRTGSLIAVATGLKGYGKDGRESHTYEGASGGPVFTPDGVLTGLSVAVIDAKLKAGEVSDYYNVRLPVEDSKKVQLTFVQPVKQTSANYFERDIAWEAPC